MTTRRSAPVIDPHTADRDGLAPLFTAFGHFAQQLDQSGADGIVLFTRFHKVDIDVIELEVVRTFPLSASSDLPLRLRGVAAIAGRVKASLAVTGGVHTALDVVKALRALTRPLTDSEALCLDLADRAGV